MKKFSILLLLCIALVGCKDKSTDFGTVKYYPSFLWVSDSISPVVKTMDCDFSIDAQNDAGSFAEFQFVDNDGKSIPTSEMQVKVDGVTADHNIFRVYSKTDSVKLEFTFSPDAETDKHQGYLKLINHKLDRLDSQQLSKGQKVDVFQWTLDYDKSMNPLAKILMWILIVVFSLALIWTVLWYVFLQKQFYPRFRAIRKTVIIPDQAPVVIRFKGARMVVLDNVMHKQKPWDKLLKGKIIYKQIPTLTAPIVFKPTSKGKKILFVNRSSKYSCVPNPIDEFRSATIEITNENRKIIIN